MKTLMKSATAAIGSGWKLTVHRINVHGKTEGAYDIDVWCGLAKTDCDEVVVYSEPSPNQELAQVVLEPTFMIDVDGKPHLKELGRTLLATIPGSGEDMLNEQRLAEKIPLPKVYQEIINLTNSLMAGD